MESKKIVLVLIIAAVVAAGWLVAVKAVTGVEELQAQEALAVEGDAYMERELYVRAISCYEKALNYSTDKNPQVEEKLLEAYLAYGDMLSYVRLAERRMSAGTASEEEYIRVADYDIFRSRLGDAMLLIKKGIERLNSGVLETYFEEHRYEYKVKHTKYTDIIPTSTNMIMPAFNGEKWGYVDQTGSVRLQFIYDRALPFNLAGYAVVLMDGIYYTILENGDKYGADDGSGYSKMTDVAAVSGTHILGERDGFYSYFNYDYEPVALGHQYIGMTSNACGVAAVKKDSGWGIITDSGGVVLNFVLEDVAVNSLNCAFAGNRAMVKTDGLWHMIDTEGHVIGEGRYADAKAPESDGYIAVADENGKWGFIDRDGEMVIDYQYSDAFSFSDGLGAVRIVNSWGYISTDNVLVIEQAMTSAKPFHNGIAQVGFVGGVSLITLKYYED